MFDFRRCTALLPVVALIVGCTASEGQSPDAASGGAASNTPDAASIVQAFFELATDETLTMHVTYDGSTEIIPEDGSDAETVGVSGEMDAAGEDFAGNVVIEAQSERLEVEVARVDGQAYSRPAGGEWQAVDDDGAQPVNPFVALEDENELEYVGETDFDGQAVHHLRTETWLGDDPAAMESDTLTDVELVSHSFDIYVTDDGTPVGGELTADLSASVNGEPASVTNAYRYTFTDVGEPVSIERPID